MKQLLIAVLFGFVSLTCGAQNHSIPRATVYPVMISGENNTIGSGSAVLITDDYFLTSAHLQGTQGRLLLTINTRAGPKQAVIVKRDPEKDLMLLKAEAKCPCATLSPIAPAVDDPVVVIGYPLGGFVKVQYATQGHVQGFSEGKMFTSAPTAPGGSGGGAFVNNNGRWLLAGTTMAIASTNGPFGGNQVQWISMFVPIDEIKKFLEGTPVRLQ